MWLVIVSVFLCGRYLSGMLWGCLIGNKFHPWHLCLGNIQTNSVWTGFVFVRILAFKPFRNITHRWVLFSTEIDPNYFILHCSVSLNKQLLILFQTIFWIKIFSRQKHCNVKRICGWFSVFSLQSQSLFVGSYIKHQNVLIL